MTKKLGFTLIELTIVIALTSGLLLVGVAVIANIYQTNNKTRSQMEVRQNLQSVLDTMAREIRQTKYVKYSTIGNIQLYNSYDSCVENNYISQYDKGAVAPFPLRQITNGVTQYLTSDKINISNLTFVGVTNTCSAPDSITINITANYHTLATRSDFTDSITISETVALRKY